MGSRARVIFHGRVQGVNFRRYAKDRALQVGLQGWVRNLEDGTVEAVVEGTRDVVEGWIRWCRERQPLARVSKVDMEWLEPRGDLKSFTIQR